MKTVYCIPYEVKNNHYINIHKKLFLELGFYPRSIKTLKFFNFFNRKNNIAYINWFEDAIVGSNGKVKLSLFTLRLLLLIYLRLLCSKLIWVQHNITPHMLRDGARNGLYFFFLRVMYKLCDFKVNHAKVDYSDKSVLIDHPLYPSVIDSRNITRDIEYLYIGTVSKYKGIESILRDWPEKLTLKIVGYCSLKELEDDIFSIIKSRNLNVTFENKFLSDEEVEIYLNRAKVVVLPHLDKTMIVSGMFYHAISNGCSILMRKGPFYDYVSGWLPYVYSFQTDDLATKLELALNNFDSEKTISIANEKCSNETLKCNWSIVLNDL